MNVGYFSVNEGLEEGKVDWEKLKGQELVSQGDFFRHIRFEKPLLVRMDGKKGIALITINR
jgi:hypothetical protein